MVYKNSKNNEAEHLIPSPEEVLDPEGIYTRSEIFDFSDKGKGQDS